MVFFNGHLLGHFLTSYQMLLVMPLDNRLSGMHFKTNTSLRLNPDRGKNTDTPVRGHVLFREVFQPEPKIHNALAMSLI